MKGFTLGDEQNFPKNRRRRNVRGHQIQCLLRRNGILPPIIVSCYFFVLFLGKRNKMKTEYVRKISFLSTEKDTFNRMLSEACE